MAKKLKITKNEKYTLRDEKKGEKNEKRGKIKNGDGKRDERKERIDWEN